MKTQKAFIGFAIASLLAMAAGCSKNQSEAPAQAAAAKAPEAAPAESSTVTTQQQVQPPTNIVVNAEEPKRPRPPGGLRVVADLAPAPVQDAAPQPASVAAAPDSATAQPNQPGLSLASLSQDQVVRGLQEALGKGLQQAIARLGHDGGFLTNLQVKIPMPEKLQKVESALRAMGQDKLADDFVTTMNHAAEQAVPEAGAVFADALKQLTISDAKSILTGTNNAATQYFEKATRTNLCTRFYPIVQKATEKTGATAAYKSLMAKVNAGDLNQKLGGLGGLIGGALFDKDSLDLDAYVTNKSMDGLFKMVAEEEKQIRQNPLARTTDLLQKVFGALNRNDETANRR